MNLNNIQPATGSTHNSKRIGRGQGSGKGGTSTKGNKGGQSRAGYLRLRAIGSEWRSLLRRGQARLSSTSRSLAGMYQPAPQSLS